MDTQIVFFAQQMPSAHIDKVTCHFYNNTHKILINGNGYRKFIDLFLKPFFMSKIESCLVEIKSYNEFVLDILGQRSVKRSTVRYKSGAPISCSRCDFTSKNKALLNKHKQNKHVPSFEASLSLREHPQSTRNNSVIEKMMIEDLSITKCDSNTG